MDPREFAQRLWGDRYFDPGGLGGGPWVLAEPGGGCGCARREGNGETGPRASCCASGSAHRPARGVPALGVSAHWHGACSPSRSGPAAPGSRPTPQPHPPLAHPPMPSTPTPPVWLQRRAHSPRRRPRAAASALLFSLSWSLCTRSTRRQGRGAVAPAVHAGWTTTLVRLPGWPGAPVHVCSLVGPCLCAPPPSHPPTPHHPPTHPHTPHAPPHSTPPPHTTALTHPTPRHPPRRWWARTSAACGPWPTSLACTSSPPLTAWTSSRCSRRRAGGQGHRGLQLPCVQHSYRARRAMGAAFGSPWIAGSSARSHSLPTASERGCSPAPTHPPVRSSLWTTPCLHLWSLVSAVRHCGRHTPRVHRSPAAPCPLRPRSSRTPPGAPPTPPRLTIHPRLAARSSAARRAWWTCWCASCPPPSAPLPPRWSAATPVSGQRLPALPQPQAPPGRAAAAARQEGTLLGQAVGMF